MFIRNLNVFVAGLIVMSALMSWMLMIPLSLALRPVFGESRASIIALPLTYVVIGALLLYAWRAGWLSPLHRKPGSEGRFKTAHVLLAFGNLSALAMLPMSFMFTWIAGSSFGKGLAAFTLPLMSLGTIALVVGLVLLWGTRGAAPVSPRADGFADTVAEGAKPQARLAAPAVQAPARSRLAVTLPVIIGLFATAFLVFLSVVFAGAAAGNSGSGSSFMAKAVPIAIGGFVLYFTTTIWLVIRRHDKSALGLAWGPVLLLVVAAPAFQVLVLAVQLLIGK